jgi:hypothetical protein
MKKIIILIALISLGCSTRKVETKKEEIKQEVSIKEDATIDVKNDIKTQEVDTSFMWKREYIPMNSYLPFTVDGKQYQNVRIETTKIKKGVSISKEDNSALKATISTKKNIETKVETKEKKQERYGNTLTIFYWFIIAIVSYITYDYYILKK